MVTLALTLWRPWHFAILHITQDPKRVENRPWKPWSSVIGQRIALHAGQYFDESVGFDYSDPRAHQAGVVGTAVVRGWIHVSKELLLSLVTDVRHSPTLTQDEARGHAASCWFFGPYGWVLEDVRALSEPIPCRGAQSLWELPQEVEQRLAEVMG